MCSNAGKIPALDASDRTPAPEGLWRPLWATVGIRLSTWLCPEQFRLSVFLFTFHISLHLQKIKFLYGPSYKEMRTHCLLFIKM